MTLNLHHFDRETRLIAPNHMRFPSSYFFPSDLKEAVALQRELAKGVIKRDRFVKVGRVAGIDVGFEGKRHEIARAAVVVLEFPELAIVEASIARRPVTFPYVPGLLAFREAPVILDALERLEYDPDLLLVDGHGRAHPRRIGIASHLGVLLDCPSIGCAKSRLVGESEMPSNHVGATSPLFDGREKIGLVVRTRENANPLYISIGHRVNLRSARSLVLECNRGYRLPEPTRLAHKLASGLLDITRLMSR